jgi:hypothetical protein
MPRSRTALKKAAEASRASQPEVAQSHQAIRIERPAYRRLRAYAFDPSLSTQLENAPINHVTIKVPWEFDLKTGQDTLQPGPVGEYLEVVDVDPASDCCYAPIDLNQPYLLAQDGLEPSEGNPQFHQQMVYAVAMTTIRNFEQALGRTSFWAPHRRSTHENGEVRWHEDYAQRLRLYPHALREANAFYSPDAKALLFGYFPASTSDSRHHLPGGMVFTCLSHDIVAHETTHALLDGMHRRFQEASNPDVLAFHEAFADIVALFQHFSMPDVLCHQIAKTRGDLATENLLLQLAQEFGQATESHAALRDALGEYQDDTWKPKVPDPTALEREFEPHARGSLLVAAVFDAFVTIYKSRVADLMRIATSGTGVLPAGNLHPDLVNRLAGEAAKSAQHVLTMCIRALDYMPPVDITFGDYLRALITADSDLVHDDDRGYRIAFVEAFRKYGIYPRDVRSLSVEGLRWSRPATLNSRLHLLPVVQELKSNLLQWSVTDRSQEIYEHLGESRKFVHQKLKSMGRTGQGAKDLKELFGLDPGKPFEVHSLRPARRVGPDGEFLTDLVIEITQARPGYFDEEVQKTVDKQGIRGISASWLEEPENELQKKVPKRKQAVSIPKPDFIFRGGCTLVIDLGTSEVRYSIYKDIDRDSRLARQRAFETSPTGNASSALRATYFSRQLRNEPFALLHRLADEVEDQWLS